LLKKFTFFLLILGLIFSTLTYLERVPLNGPTESDINSFVWIKENIPQNKIILSAAENTYFIKYFTSREPFTDPLRKNNSIIWSTILSAPYITDLFPLLEDNNISIIYIGEDMNKQLPHDKGLLYLFKNERFKLVHSHEDSEVWVFKESQEKGS